MNKKIDKKRVGQQEGLQTVAYKLLQQSMEIPSICQATGFSKEQILALKKINLKRFFAISP